MSTPVQFPNQSLYGIESNIASLMACRDEAAEEGDAEAVSAADALIAEWTSQEVLGRKVNGIVYAIREYRKRAEIAKEEAARISAHAREWEEKAKRVEQSTLAAMLVHNVTRIESETNTLKVQKNGGVQPLEVSDAAAIPEEFLLGSFTTSMKTWREIGRWLGMHEEGLHLWHKLSECLYGAPPQPYSHEIRKALAEKVPCPECDGRPDHVHYTDEESGCSDDLMTCPRCMDKPISPLKTCPTCEGKGTIPRTIPGARLLDRGHHLRYE